MTEPTYCQTCGDVTTNGDRCVDCEASDVPVEYIRCRGCGVRVSTDELEWHIFEEPCPGGEGATL
jgi:hypothetical protein